MTNSNPHHALVLTVLQHVSTDRLHRAVNALADGSLTLTLTRQTEAEIRALVQNGEGKEYGLTLTEMGVFCSCPDALYRGVICKHAVALALSVLRTPVKETSPLHLMWRNGAALCGVNHPERFWVWPWSETVVTWPEICTACVTAWKQPAKVAA